MNRCSEGKLSKENHSCGHGSQFKTGEQKIQQFNYANNTILTLMNLGFQNEKTTRSIPKRKQKLIVKIVAFVKTEEQIANTSITLVTRDVVVVRIHRNKEKN